MFRFIHFLLDGLVLALALAILAAVIMAGLH